MELNELMSLANKNDIFLPLITFFNQQGNRWTQDQVVFIEPLGRTTYRERFTATLQAPDFDFSAYPFDRQKFNVHIDLTVPTEVFIFEGIENPVDPLGDQLGEEEWSLINFFQGTKEVPYDKNLKNSRFTTTLEMKRHLARNVKSAHHVDWIGEIYDSRKLWVWSANIINVDIN